MKLFISFFLFTLFYSSINYAQLIVKDQDSSPNTLLQVNDEGAAGSITLPNVGNSLSGTKLYNYGGNLFWGSNQLGLAGSSGGWTDNGTLIYNTNLADNVGIGTSAPSAKLHLKNTYELLRLESTIADGYFTIFNTVGGVSAYKGYFGTFSGDNDIDIGTGDLNTNGNLNLVTKATPRVVVSPDGDVDIKSGELNRSGKTGTANLVPLAYANISLTGGILSGSSGNISCTYYEPAKTYNITISGESSYSDVVVLLTNRSGSPAKILAWYIEAGIIKVRAHNITTNSLDHADFSILIYRP